MPTYLMDSFMKRRFRNFIRLIEKRGIVDWTRLGLSIEREFQFFSEKKYYWMDKWKKSFLSFLVSVFFIWSIRKISWFEWNFVFFIEQVELFSISVPIKLSFNVFIFISNVNIVERSKKMYGGKIKSLFH